MFARSIIHDCPPAPRRVVSWHTRDSADMEFAPTENGEMTSADIRVHILATPDSLQWDRVSSRCIRRADHFTVESAESNDTTSCCEFALVSCEM
jgi:hypothetical protein